MKNGLTNQNEKAVLHPFVHLHTHTEYSLLDGIAKISELVDKAMSDGMPGIAITDHANMCGIAEFVEYVERKNRELGTSFKPIIGCEIYVARRGMEQKGDREDFAGYHLVLLAKNLTGYKNLVKIVSRSWLEGYYGRPRTDHTDLERYHEGLICCSACIGGEVAQHILHNDLASAEHTARWYKSVFGEDYYFELHRHKPTVERANHNTHKLEQKVNNQLLALSEKLGIKLICANDIHFVDEEDAEAQDTLLCINSNKRYDDVSRLIFSKQEWLKTTAEMNELFGDIPEVLDNTMEIFNKVEHYSINHAPTFPLPALPEGVDEVEHLARLSFEGAHKRYGEHLSDKVKERLKQELKIINRKGCPAYFLMWHEIISAAHQMGAAGVGRGSAVRSLVLYCLGITQVDPLKFGLSFEEFLKPGSLALPNIEVDFDEEGRERVVKWIVERYGEESVANIVAFKHTTAKSAKQKVTKAHEIATIDNKRLTIVQTLEGVTRGCDINACGVALCGGEISERVPLAFVSTPQYENAVIVTQYAAEQLRNVGVIVLNILSLKILSVIKQCANSVDVDIENIPIDDKATFDLLRRGDTEWVFQFDSDEMRHLLQEAQPHCFEELVALYSCHCTNRAQAVCYTLLAYQTAYLKAHYPAEYAEACKKRQNTEL